MLAVALPRTIASSINLRRATPVLPIAIGRPSSLPHRPLPKQPVNPPRQQTARDEIPIAPDAPHCPTSRGFLPWRFADAGPGVRRATVMGRHPKTFTNSEVVASIDHLIGASNQRRWYFEAERPGGLQINDQLEFGGLIERDVARFGPAQDLVHVTRCFNCGKSNLIPYARRRSVRVQLKVSIGWRGSYRLPTESYLFRPNASRFDPSRRW